MLILLGGALIAGCQMLGQLPKNQAPSVTDIGGYHPPSGRINFTAASDPDSEDIVEQVQFQAYYSGKWGAPYVDPQIADGWSYSWDSIRAGVMFDNNVRVRARAYDGIAWGSWYEEGPFIVDNGIPPVANANGPYLGNEGSPITLDASASSDPDGTIVLYEWDLDGDGTFETGIPDAIIYHTYGDDYSGSIALRVVDNDGLTGTDSTIASIVNGIPTVEAGPDQVVDEGLFSFSATFTVPGWLDTHSATID